MDLAMTQIFHIYCTFVQCYKYRILCICDTVHCILRLLYEICHSVKSVLLYWISGMIISYLVLSKLITTWNALSAPTSNGVRLTLSKKWIGIKCVWNVILRL